jgi:hypothetical protein
MSHGVSYTASRPVRINVRRRGSRYDIDDDGGAVRELGWNVNRAGVVSMQGFEGRDIDRLVRGTAVASKAVFDAVLEASTRS